MAPLAVCPPQMIQHAITPHLVLTDIPSELFESIVLLLAIELKASGLRLLKVRGLVVHTDMNSVSGPRPIVSSLGRTYMRKVWSQVRSSRSLLMCPVDTAVGLPLRSEVGVWRLSDATLRRLEDSKAVIGTCLDAVVGIRDAWD